MNYGADVDACDGSEKTTLQHHKLLGQGGWTVLHRTSDSGYKDAILNLLEGMGAMTKLRKALTTSSYLQHANALCALADEVTLM